MSQSKRRRLLRFSLRTFLLFCLVCGIGVGWVSNNYHEYLAEQRLIEDLSMRRAQRSVVAVATNGKTEWIGASRLL